MNGVPLEQRQRALEALRRATSRDEAATRRSIYTDVEEMITVGFVAQPVEIGGVPVSMRSLCPSDYLLLRHRVGLTMNGRNWREWAVATSVWMVDGQVVLGEVNAAKPIRDSLRNLPAGALDSLFTVFMTLYNRIAKAIGRTEAFCYEDHSRALWRMVGGLMTTSGLSADGPVKTAQTLNHVQRMWVAFNVSEDERMRWNQEWAAAKLSASAQAPKGIRRLNAREESERKLELERRQQVIAKTYNEATGRHLGEDAQTVFVRSVTAEELAEEMQRSQRGEKDFHDRIIDAYKDAIRKKHEDDRLRHEQRMAAVAEMSEVGVVGRTTLVGHTLEQLRAMGSEPRRGTTRVVDGAQPMHIYQKWVESDAPVGALGKGGRAVSVPSREGSQSLAEAVAARRPRLSDDGGEG